MNLSTWMLLPIAEMIQLEVQKYMKGKGIAEDTPIAATCSTDFAGITHNLPKSQHGWIIDSGATNHICADLNSFSNLRELQSNNSVTLPDGSVKTVKYSRDVALKPNLILHNVLFIPEFYLNLISVHKLTSHNRMKLLFDGDKCIMQDPLSKKVIVEGVALKGLYWFIKEDVRAAPTSTLLTCNSAVTDSFWHERLGHPSVKVLTKLPFVQKPVNDCVCDSCHVAKQTRSSFGLSEISTSQCFELLHIDIWGPYHITSISGAKYFLTIVDDFSRSVWTFLMQDKTQAVKLIDNFINYAAN